MDKLNARAIRKVNDQLDAKIRVALEGVTVPIMSLHLIRKAALLAVAHATDVDAAIAATIESVRVNA
jgi:hypothetical protein